MLTVRNESDLLEQAGVAKNDADPLVDQAGAGPVRANLNRRTMLVSSPFDDFVDAYGATPRRGLFGMLVHDLGRRIVGGEFPEGEVLPNEDDLIARFQISRTTFREAMKSLASKGLVEIRPKIGTRVRSRNQWHQTDPDIMVWQFETGPSPEFLEALIDIRRVLEPAAAARAARRATPEDLLALRTAFEDMCISASDPVGYARADQAFHAAVFAASGNMLLRRMIDVVAIGIYGNQVLSPRNIVEGQRRSLPWHEDVISAIEARDPEAAAIAVHRLLDTWDPAPDDRGALPPMRNPNSKPGKRQP